MRIIGREPIDRSKIDRILIRATNWVGDLVMTMPALEAVRENFSRSTLVVLARPWVIPLIENHPAVDRVLPLDKTGRFRSDLIEILKVARLIRQMRFDLAILFQNSFEAALLAYLGGVRLRVGYDTDGRGLLLSHPVGRDDTILNGHQVEYYLSILRAMGWEARSRDPSLVVAGKDIEAIGPMLSSGGIGPGDFLLGLSPGAIYGPAKRWPADRFAMIGDRAVEHWGAKVIVLGSPGEKEICGLVTGSMKHPGMDLCGRTTLGQAMALIQRCNLVVTNDSGLMHVAGALRTPTVAIFGSTNPATTGPLGEKARIVRHPVECAPCLKQECPTDYRCMLDIGPEDVWKEMETLRERRR